jgi:OFA family oxalate/formate antiporter-like MFS transporter
MILGGKHNDKKGPRVVVTIGSACLTAGFFLAATTESLTTLYLSYGVLCGFGIGYANIAPIAVAMRWFPDKRGLVSGILVMGFGLAAFVLGSAASEIISTMGWPTAFRVLGGTSLVLCLLGAQFMKYPPEGFAPKGMEKPQTAKTAEPDKTKARNYDWKQMMGTATWWWWWTFHLMVLTGGLMVIGHIVPFALESGVNKDSAVFAMGVFAVMNGLGRLLIGALWDRLGRNKTMTLNAALMLIGLLCLGFLVEVLHFPILVTAVLLIGLAYGGCIPIASSLISACFGNKYFGINYGLATTPLLIGAMVGPFLGGYLHTTTQNYDTAIMISAALSIVGILAGIVIKDPKPQGS